MIDPYYDNKEKNDDKIVKGDYIENDDYSLSFESLKGKVNSVTAFGDSSGSISYLFTDDEYDYRKGTTEDDDNNDTDDDKEDDDKNSLPLKYTINNNDITTTGIYTTNRRGLNRRQNSRLSDITFDSNHDNNELISLNDSAFILGESLMGSRRFAPNYCGGNSSSSGSESDSESDNSGSNKSTFVLDESLMGSRRFAPNYYTYGNHNNSNGSGSGSASGNGCSTKNSVDNKKNTSNTTIEEENQQQQDHHQRCSDTTKRKSASKQSCGATAFSSTTAPPSMPRRSISNLSYHRINSNPPTIPHRTSSNKSSVVSGDSLHSSYASAA